MPPTIRRQTHNHGRVQIDLPRLMTDDQLAEVLKAFVSTAFCPLITLAVAARKSSDSVSSLSIHCS
jgi:hypothetical protein